MKLLAVETALGACSVAVLDGENILAHRFQEMTRGHAEALAPMVEEAMREAGIAFAALDRLAALTRRSRSFLAAEALDRYLGEELAIVDGIIAGLEDADAGRVVAHEAVVADLDRIIAQARRRQQRKSA